MRSSTKRKPATRKQGSCSTDGCRNGAEVCGMCKPCYSVDYYWTRKKNAAQRRQRVEQLSLWQRRMEAVATPRLRSVK